MNYSELVIYIHTYICTHIYIYISMYGYMQTYTHIHIQTYIYIEKIETRKNKDGRLTLVFHKPLDMMIKPTFFKKIFFG